MYITAAQVGKAADYIPLKDLLPCFYRGFYLPAVLLEQGNKEMLRQGRVFQRGFTGYFLVVTQTESTMKMM
jgi:hypothetical protein